MIVSVPLDPGGSPAERRAHSARLVEAFGQRVGRMFDGELTLFSSDPRAPAWVRRVALAEQDRRARLEAT